ncbi:MAG TPA: protein kinase [Myxococcota bacterium]
MNPQMFGRYLLLDKVAAGGMAEVWRGKVTGEASFQKIHAIKKILPHVAEDEDFITMFTDEALITASLQHANIGQVYEFSKIGDVYFIAMEYISGRDLKSVWSWSKARGQIMPIELSAFIVSKMADGLDYAHSRKDNQGRPSGVVHRDISPQNVLLSWEGDVKVIDFGIAKATEKSGKTRPGTLKGKFAYMAPEQIRGLPLDGRSDIFALGVVLYEMVTGQRGFQAESEFSLLEMVRNVEIRPPSLLNQTLPAELERIIFKAIAKDRDQRYQTGADLSEDLQRFLLTRGKPPQARDLAAFLRENFTVDYEKERARLESYREINAADFAPERVAARHQQAAAAQGPGSPPLTLDDDSAFSSSEDDSGFASSSPSLSQPTAPTTSPPSSANGFAPAMRGGAGMVTAVMPRAETTGSTATDLRPPRDNSVPGVPTPTGPSKLPKLIAAGVGAAVVLGALGFGAATLLKPTTTVVVTVQGPSEASVRFDALPPQPATPSVSFEKIAAGTHTVLVEAKGYVPFSMPVVTEGQALQPVKVEMKRVGGRLTITSDPSGASIVLDGKPTDKLTPSTFDLDGDSIHEVRLSREGYKDAVKTDLRVKAGEEISERVKLPPSVVKLRIASVPEGASVKVGELDMGITPVVIERSPEDPYPQITVSAKGCDTLQTTVPFDREKAEDRYDVTLKCR